MANEVNVESSVSARIFVDGRHLQVDPGMTILEAAEENGISIPTLCNDPRLEPVGRCRLCVVDIGKGERPWLSV